MATWNPNAWCEGFRAEDRATWVVENRGLSVDAARQQVMAEFPKVFSVVETWNPDALCEGIRAEDRATWVVENRGLSVDAARQQVMAEFPKVFSVVETWNPDALCEGIRAEDRATWVVENRGLSMHAARQQVMAEFPKLFGGAARAAPVQAPVAAPALGAPPRSWNPEASCGGAFAKDRADWLVQNSGITPHAAREQVMDEFPAQFLVHTPPAAAETCLPPKTAASPYPSDPVQSTATMCPSPAQVSKPAGPEPNPPRWPDSVMILSHASGYQIVDDIYADMAPVDKGQFSTKRYAVMFEPSDQMHEVDVRVGYYTSLYGLGLHPSKTKIRSVTCTNDTSDPELGSLQNFWRSAENFQTGQHPTYGLDGQGGMLWAVSQAAPLRRVMVQGNLFLWYFRLPPNGVTASDARYPFQGACLEYPDWVKKGITDPFGDFASGGFMANVSVDGFVSLGSQQQFFLRNCSANTYKNGAWNFVFVGCPGTMDPAGAIYSTINTTRVVAEKPFIAKDGDKFKLVVPAAKKARSGVDYDVNDDEIRDFSNVFVAEPSTTAAEINGRLAEGKDIVFTPGIYQLSETIIVSQNEQVLLGLGYATLVSPSNDSPCILADENASGIRVSGFMLEAAYKRLGSAQPKDFTSRGPVALLQWGRPDAVTSPRDPSLLSSWSFIHDCFARVGGQEAPYTARDEADGSRPTLRPGGGELFACEARCENMVQINTPCVVGDNLWLWRADHWLSDQYLVYNHENACNTGLHVSQSAPHVTMYGLFCEHALSDQTLWEGDHGTTFFYQCELPYDALDETAAAAKDLQPFTGAGDRVGDSVTRHEAYGVGVYAFFRDYDVTVEAGAQAPNSAGVNIRNALTKYLNGGPATYVAGKACLECKQQYGNIACVIKKGGQVHGESTNSDKDKPHFASA